MKPTFDYSSVFKIGSHGLVSLVVSGFIANVAVAAPASNALPTGGAVVGGNVNIVTSAATMNINQASSKSVINWNTYNIGSAATVNYNFANAGSSSLNRVLSNNPSEIYGKLNANGKVILVNPNGIVFGSGSSVNVGSLVATTMNIKDADYLSDRLLFTRDVSIGKILTEGTITAEDKGYIALLAPEVVNKGVIKATMGTV
ncbi:MAG: filamentous hemagglutinin N-terminal domain-containing protein, partial [Campylobacterales bacterium]|nr:filamentous hemagglutinin N-terminal domain-containing protein [Campylobacterales bacterium]